MDLNRVDLNLLVALDALLAEGSVTRAAQRLSVGQSAMSATLGRIRGLFDDPILVRQGRHLVATPYAETLIEPLQEILAAVKALLGPQTRDFDPARDTRTFTLAASEYTTLILLHEMIIRLAEEAPGVRLRIEPLDEGHLEKLRSNEIDLLLVPRELLPETVVFPHRRLLSDRFVLAVAADHPEVGDRLSREQLAALPFLSTRAIGQPSIAENRLDGAGISRRSDLTTSMTMAPFLLRGTRMVSLIYENLGRLVADEVQLRLLEPPVALAPVHETMVWAPRHDHDPGLAWLRDRLLRLVEELEWSRPPAQQEPRH